MTGAQRPARPARTLPQKLGAVVLGFESIVVALGGLTIFGLRALPPGLEPWWGIVGGAVVSLAMMATAGLIAKPWGITLGWILQIVVALSAFLVPAMGIVALIFGGMWAYATIMGARIDAKRPAGPIDPQTESE